jgi:iron complex outermembrane recepter protein
MLQSRRGPRAVVCCLAQFAACAAPALAAENPATRIELPVVEVISTTPLPGIGVPLEQVPANVESATAGDMQRRQSVDITDFLDGQLGSVNINGAQNNPLQPDVTFRGFMASPLLGTPQGLSVFMDGVRVNEAFGDVVNWDLIPLVAISTVNLIPGSNPVFGLNSLGGALSIQTKSGFQHPGFAAQASGGSFGRRSGEFEWGGSRGRNDFFIAADRFVEDGWREHSSSDVSRVFAKAGFQDKRTDFDVSFIGANNTLNGTQALPLSMLDRPQQAYTWPDRTDNQLSFFNARASHFVSNTLLVSGNAYYRDLRTSGFFSNVNDDFDPLLPAGAGNSEGFNVSNQTDQTTWGGALQLTLTSPLAGRGNQLSIGIAADLGDTDFVQSQQEAQFTADRGTAGFGPFTLITAVNTENRYYGLYLSDVYSVTEQLHLSLGGRYNRAQVRIADRSGTNPALDGTNNFSRFNPALGLAYSPDRRTTAYVSYNEGMRVPTPVELTCASPAAPCQLPNAFLADPPLQPVISSTWEAGMRGKAGAATDWRFAVYNAVLRDDILFVNTGAAINAGFFQNIGETRRRGLELAGQTRIGQYTFHASYAYVQATFESPLTLPSPNNSSAVDLDGDGQPESIFVNPGNRLPGIPQQRLKLRAEYQPAQTTLFGLTMVAASGQYARGDENNQDVNGQVPGYAVFNVDARYNFARGWDLVARVNNLFDKSYQTFGVLGENFFRGPDGTFDATAAGPEQFRSSGAPRGGWVGVQYRFAEAPSR